jgi:hypothetical protein
MRALLDSSEKLIHTSFYYQYCAFRTCRSFEAVISDRRTPNFTFGLQKMLADAGLAVMTIGHTEEDVRQEHPVNIKTYGSDGTPVADTMSWDDFANLLLYIHKLHASASRHKGCRNFDAQHLGYARDSANDEDLSISNVLRDVPGVRHLDTDGLFLCPLCGKPTLLIEATSDGFENSNYKATYMSERLANLLNMNFALVQHSRGAIKELIVTRSVLVAPDNHDEYYRKATTVMSPEEFLSFLEEDRPHECIR